MTNISRIIGYKITQKPPSHRLWELAEEWNNLTWSIVDEQLLKKVEALKSEMAAIIKEHPDLNDTIVLKEYYYNSK